MRMTTRQLKQIIKEEVDRSLNEFDISSATGGMVDPDRVDMVKAMVTLDLSVLGLAPQTIPVNVAAKTRSFDSNVAATKVGKIDITIGGDQFDDFMSGNPVVGDIAVSPKYSSMRQYMQYTIRRA